MDNPLYRLLRAVGHNHKGGWYGWGWKNEEERFRRGLGAPVNLN